MADKPINSLPEALDISDNDSFVLEQNSTAKRLTGKKLLEVLLFKLDGHGGISSIDLIDSNSFTLEDSYLIKYTDGSSQVITIKNGRGIVGISRTDFDKNRDIYTIVYNDSTTSTFEVRHGSDGKNGNDAYVWVRYASEHPSDVNPSFGVVPDRWIGVYSGSNPSAPTQWSAYDWYDMKGERGRAIYRVNGNNKPLERYAFSDFAMPNGYKPMVNDLVITNDGYLGYVSEVFADNQVADVATLDLSLNGKSAYAYAVEAGFGGTEKDFLEILLGGNEIMICDLVANDEGEYSASATYYEIADANANNKLVLLRYGAFVTHILAGAPTDTSFLFEPILHGIPGIHGYTVDSKDNWSDAKPVGLLYASDIIDNLSTSVSDKPLSAAQGVVLKGLIDDLARNGNEVLVYGYANDTKITLAVQSGRPVYCLYEHLYYLPLVSWDEATHTAVFGGCCDSKIITCMAVAGEWSVEITDVSAGEQEVFVGTEDTTVAEFHAAFESGKPCFLIKANAGEGTIMWVAYTCNSSSAKFYRVTANGSIQYGVLSSDGTFSYETAENEREVFVGDANTTVAEYYEAFMVNKKPCFMLRASGGTGLTMWVAYTCNQNNAQFYRINGSGAIQYGMLNSDNTFEYSGVLITKSIDEKSTDEQIPTAKAVYAYTKDKLDSPALLKTENETPVLGSELATASGWTADGWTGDFASGFNHTSGNTNALSFEIPGIAAGKSYVIEFDCSVDYTNTNLLVTIGAAPAMLLFGINRTNTKVGVIAVDTGALTFTPESAFVGKISNISVREITEVSIPSQIIKSSNGTVISETRHIGENLFIGKGVGGKTVPGAGENYAIGNDKTFQNNISGFWNVAIGTDCMNGNVSGSRNVSIGANNLRNNVEGCRNVSIGNFAMAQTKNAHRNVAIGGDCMSTATGGEDNVAVGYQALYPNTTGKQNVAIGSGALTANTTGRGNIGIGYTALSKNTSGLNNIAIGFGAGKSLVSGNGNIAIGVNADIANGSYYALNIGNLLKGSVQSGSAYLLVNGGLRLPGIGTEQTANNDVYSEEWTFTLEDGSTVTKKVLMV